MWVPAALAQRRLSLLLTLVSHFPLSSTLIVWRRIVAAESPVPGSPQVLLATLFEWRSRDA